MSYININATQLIFFAAETFFIYLQKNAKKLAIKVKNLWNKLK